MFFIPDNIVDLDKEK